MSTAEQKQCGRAAGLRPAAPHYSFFCRGHPLPFPLHFCLHLCKTPYAKHFLEVLEKHGFPKSALHKVSFFAPDYPPTPLWGLRRAGSPLLEDKLVGMAQMGFPDFQRMLKFLFCHPHLFVLKCKQKCQGDPWQRMRHNTHPPNQKEMCGWA